ncbi:Vascular endothelial growth factor receptor 1 [Hypsibius exemplaris]|uniref:Vascular endothelial growth factor receptor 1 n=1 Tax=Hypsibius exemplaris TaxID=2072580 RepID=A0A1W0W995_HYPEX|nr:Vascular endothelial growth factor receptor 1 [Hypsibius exemplaris]
MAFRLCEGLVLFAMIKLGKLQDNVLWEDDAGHCDANGLIRPPSPSVLRSGDTLSSGNSIKSPNQRHFLSMQGDGNLVLYRKCKSNSKDKTTWATGREFPGMGHARFAIMAENGDLAISNDIKSTIYLWNSSTASQRFSGAHLRVEDSGFVCIKKNGRCLWRSGGWQGCDPVPWPAFQDAQVILRSDGDRLRAGQTVFSKHRSCNLSLDVGLNLVLRRQCDGATISLVPQSVSSPVPKFDDSSVEWDFAAYSKGYPAWLLNKFFLLNSSNDFVPAKNRSNSAELRLLDDCQMCIYKDSACLWTHHWVAPDCENRIAPSNFTQYIMSGGRLSAGQSIWSPSQNVELRMQEDGNLVIYRTCDGASIWYTTTNYAVGKPESVVMESSGLLAMRRHDCSLTWSSGTVGMWFAGARLRLKDSGSLCIENQQGDCLWNSGGFALCKPIPSPTFEEAKVILQPGERIAPGQRLYSKSRTCFLTLEHTGNLVVYRVCDEASVFALRHENGSAEGLGLRDVIFAIDFGINRDGNLEWTPINSATELYKNITHRTLGTNAAKSACLSLSDDCVMCVFKNGVCLWTAHHLTYACPSTPGSGAIAGGVVALFLVALVCLLIIRRKWQQRQSGQRIVKLEWQHNRLMANFYSFKDRSGERESEQFLEICSQYITLLEIAREKLELSDAVLGRGKFGIVYKALAHDLPTVAKSPTIVAAKTFTDRVDPHNISQLGEEMKVMLKCGQHNNIVNLLGIVRHERPFLLLEYCKYGSLSSFLKEKRWGFYSHLDETGNPTPFVQADIDLQGTQACNDQGWTPEEKSMDEHILCTDDLLKFGHQICRGMEHLASRSIIHRDLAARNVLVTGERVMKISDFGLARHGADSYTVVNAFIPLPILWMPPDTILTRQFSEKSDVWSFGVLLWEIFSLGLAPFDGPDVAKFSAAAFAEWLLQGNQLSRPINASESIFNIIKSCWELKPSERPTFTEIWKILDEMLCQTEGGSTYMVMDTLEGCDNRLDELDKKVTAYLAETVAQDQSECEL